MERSDVVPVGMAEPDPFKVPWIDHCAEGRDELILLDNRACVDEQGRRPMEYEGIDRHEAHTGNGEAGSDHVDIGCCLVSVHAAAPLGLEESCRCWLVVAVVGSNRWGWERQD